MYECLNERMGEWTNMDEDGWKNWWMIEWKDEWMNCHRIEYSKLSNLNVKFNNDKSRDYMNPSLPTGDPTLDLSHSTALATQSLVGPGNWNYLQTFKFALCKHVGVLLFCFMNKKWHLFIEICNFTVRLIILGNRKTTVKIQVLVLNSSINIKKTVIVQCTQTHFSVKS